MEDIANNITLARYLMNDDDFVLRLLQGSCWKSDKTSVNTSTNLRPST